MAGKTEVEIPCSGIKFSVAEILGKMKFIGKAEKVGKKNRKYINIILKYEDGVPAISGLRRVSKQGHRTYAGYKEMKPVKGNKGFSIISTSKGLMTNFEARKQKLGGEIILEAW